MANDFVALEIDTTGLCDWNDDERIVDDDCQK